MTLNGVLANIGAPVVCNVYVSPLLSKSDKKGLHEITVNSQG